MQPANSVSALFAQIQAYKVLWAGSRPKEAAFERYLTAGQNVDATLFETRAHGLPEVLLKLVELMEWLHDDATPSQLSLLASAIADLDGFLGGEALLGSPKPSPLPPAPAAATRRKTLDELRAEAAAKTFDQRLRESRPKGRKAKKAKPKNEPVKAIGKINLPSNWRPVEIKGVLYPNISAASEQTGLAYAEVRKLALTQ